MRIALITFVKTPGRTPSKTRLAKTIGTLKAEEFYRLSLECVRDIYQIISTTEFRDAKITPYYTVAERTILDASYWWPFGYFSQEGETLAERLYYAQKYGFKDHDAVILMGSDCPSLGMTEIAKTVKWLTTKKQRYIVGPAQDGGFYLFASKTQIPLEKWQQVPYSSDNTCEKLIGLLKRDEDPLLLEPLRDVDYYEDLLSELAYLRSLSERTASQEKVVEFMKQYHLKEV